MKKASQTTWLANINPNNQTAMCQVSITRLFIIVSIRSDKELYYRG